MTSARTRVGGVGAALFLAAFCGIAAYIHENREPTELDAIRTATTLAVEETEATPAAHRPPPPLPWYERLDLNALSREHSRNAADVVAEKTTLDTLANPEPVELDGSRPQRARPAGKAPTQKRGRAQPNRAPATGPEGFVQTLTDGHRVLYTLDPELQDAAVTIFRNRDIPYGSAVILDLKDNRVLALAGYSAADPKVDPIDIVTTPWAPAASTFKLVTTAALVAERQANGKTRVCFHGGLSGITDDLLEDNRKLDTRCETLADAVAHSHNVIIAKLALKHLTRDNLINAAHRFQFDREIPFEFPVESSPIAVPTAAKARAKVAAGFWHVDMSPLHGAILASIFARGGVYQAPHVVAEVLTPDGELVVPTLPEAPQVVDARAARAVGEMMLLTTTEGTAKRSFRDRRTGASYTPGVDVAGKTGSLTGKRAPGYNYNWFIGFAPADDPEIAFAVVLANPAKWQIKAHYAARRLVQIYWSRREEIARTRELQLSDEGLIHLNTPNLAAQKPTRPAVAAAASEATLAEARARADSEQAQLTRKEPRAVAIPTRKADPQEARVPSSEDELPPVPGALPRNLRPNDRAK